MVAVLRLFFGREGGLLRRVSLLLRVNERESCCEECSSLGSCPGFLLKVDKVVTFCHSVTFCSLSALSSPFVKTRRKAVQGSTRLSNLDINLRKNSGITVNNLEINARDRGYTLGVGHFPTFSHFLRFIGVSHFPDTFLTVSQNIINPDPGRQEEEVLAQKHPFETLGFSEITEINDRSRRPGSGV